MQPHNHYHDHLYPLQDKFLTFLNLHGDRKFYLTGGTALSRFYFEHRYSDDLDFFTVEDLKEFRSLGTTIVNSAKKQGFTIEVETLSDHFLRLFVKEGPTSLKVDFVNEVVLHWGKFKNFSLFHDIDNETNILANKITCITRHEVKDIVDIWILAKQQAFSWRDILDIANKKSPTDPLEVSKIIKTLPKDELKLVKWTSDVDWHEIYLELQIIAKDILLGKMNSLKTF